MHSLAGSEGAGSGRDPHSLTWWQGVAREKLDQTPGDFSAMARNLGPSPALVRRKSSVNVIMS